MEASKFDENVKTVKQLIGNLVDDPNREGLLDTPRRVAKVWEYMTAGYREDPQQVVSTAIYNVEHEDMVVVRDVRFTVYANTTCYPSLANVMSAIFPTVRSLGCPKFPV